MMNIKDEKEACRRYRQRIADICARLMYEEDLQLVEYVADVCLSTEQTSDIEPQMMFAAYRLMQRHSGSQENLGIISRFLRDLRVSK